LAKQPLEGFCLHRSALALLGGIASRLLAQPALRAEPVFSCWSRGDSWDASRHLARPVACPVSHPHDICHRWIRLRSILILNLKILKQNHTRAHWWSWLIQGMYPQPAGLDCTSSAWTNAYENWGHYISRVLTNSFFKPLKTGNWSLTYLFQLCD
jgi:hypothetical protein